jgi:hypothetical protein
METEAKLENGEGEIGDSRRDRCSLITLKWIRHEVIVDDGREGDRAAVVNCGAKQEVEGPARIGNRGRRAAVAREDAPAAGVDGSREDGRTGGVQIGEMLEVFEGPGAVGNRGEGAAVADENAFAASVETGAEGNRPAVVNRGAAVQTSDRKAAQGPAGVGNGGDRSAVAAKIPCPSESRMA